MMTRDEVIEVLSWLYAHRGHPDPTNPVHVDSWMKVLVGVEKECALDVIVEHHRSNDGSFLMAADIRERCTACV